MVQCPQYPLIKTFVIELVYLRDIWYKWTFVFDHFTFDSIYFNLYKTWLNANNFIIFIAFVLNDRKTLFFLPRFDEQSMCLTFDIADFTKFSRNIVILYYHLYLRFQVWALSRYHLLIILLVHYLHNICTKYFTNILFLCLYNGINCSVLNTFYQRLFVPMALCILRCKDWLGPFSNLTIKLATSPPLFLSRTPLTSTLLSSNGCCWKTEGRPNDRPD